MLDNATETSYIFNGKEVKLTGRLAKKPVYHKIDVNKKIGEMTLVEICPIAGNVSLMGSISTEWVNPRDLYYVIMEEAVNDIDVKTLIKDNEKVTSND